VIALRDRILTPPWQERFAARLGASTITRVDAGHQLLQTRPQAVAEILLAEIKDAV
jgi:pimeloyl-ACP methyl ester carboxylesterase